MAESWLAAVQRLSISHSPGSQAGSCLAARRQAPDRAFPIRHRCQAVAHRPPGLRPRGLPHLPKRMDPYGLGLLR